MKIKLLILSDDEFYTKRISLAFSKYSSNMEIYIFKDLQCAYEDLKNSNINVIIAERNFEVDANMFSPYCAFAYFVEDSSIDEINNIPAIGKYQNVEAIYKRIVDLYSDTSGKTVVLKKKEFNGTCKKILFTSFSGGTGVSSMSVACCMEAVSANSRVLYFNLERTPSTKAFFNAEGNQSFTDVIYAIKSNPKNLVLKLESAVKKDKSGVLFYDEPQVSLEMSELTSDEIDNLFKELEASDLFDFIIVDYSYCGTENDMKFMTGFDSIVIVGDGSELSNHKSEKAVESIKIYEQENAVDILSNTVIVYNKYSNKTSTDMTAGNLRNIGGAPRLEHAKSNEVIKFLAEKKIFSSLL